MHATNTGQNVGLLERRIIELLTTTNLTFKEIILQLDGENLTASIGVIRRINRDNRYRRPRYDSKLTPAQRESLVEELRDHQGVKPNLSLLAKRYGVCHGSVWYWWDKLNRVKQRCEPFQRRSFKAKSFLRRSQQMSQLLSGAPPRHYNHHHHHHHHHHQTSNSMRTRAAAAVIKERRDPICDSDFGAERFNLVGRVSIVMHDKLSAVELPILMLSRASDHLSEHHVKWPIKMGDSYHQETALDIKTNQKESERRLFKFSDDPLPLVKAEV